MIPITRLRVFSLVFVLGLFLPTLAACGTAGSGTTLRVGAKDFTEEYIVGHMYKLLLEEAGFKVELKMDIATPAAQAAMEAKELDLYPEYTGTGLTTVLKLPASSDPNRVHTSSASTCPTSSVTPVRSRSARRVTAPRARPPANAATNPLASVASAAA